MIDPIVVVAESCDSLYRGDSVAEASQRGVKLTARSRSKWLVGLWIFSTVLATAGWWVGLSWAATLLAQYAVS
jgi:hypothetical protein